MRARRQPRYQGKVTSWKDEQGYGFISPNGGGPAVFLHVSALSSSAARPALDDVVTYHLETNDKGQPRAANVAFAGAERRDDAPARAPGASGGAIAGAFFVFLGLCVYLGRIPAWMLAVYAAASVVTVLAYAADKAAARAQNRRTPENTLHLLALAGGWPGALVAQQRFRHKTRKQSFRAVFWLTVVLNCALLGYAMSHFAPAWLRAGG